MPRKLWLERRAVDLSRALAEYISFAYANTEFRERPDTAENVAEWIDELADVWHAIRCERNSD